MNITSSTDYQSSISTNITINPSVTDNVDNNLTATCSHTSDDSFAFGDTAVNCNVTDSSGNRDTCSFMVKITGKSYLRFSFIEKFPNLLNHLKHLVGDKILMDRYIYEILKEKSYISLLLSEIEDFFSIFLFVPHSASFSFF